MTASIDRIKLIRAAVEGLQAPAAKITPSQAQITAGFVVAKVAINAMVAQLVPPWAMGYVNITDDEIHAISDAVTKAVVNVPTGA
jgi:hypothetical protein